MYRQGITLEQLIAVRGSNFPGYKAYKPIGPKWGKMFQMGMPFAQSAKQIHKNIQTSNPMAVTIPTGGSSNLLGIENMRSSQARLNTFLQCRTNRALVEAVR